MTIASNYPSIRPSLLLDFANTKQLDPRITYTRASTGTYYDGKTVAKAEENLLLQSSAFDNASWTKVTTTVTTNSLAAPDGTTTADTLTAGDANSTTLQTYTAIAVPYTFSVWLYRKTGTGNVDITVDGTTWVTQTLTAGWTRFSTVLTPAAGSKTAGIRLATGGDEVYAWGAQLEQRSTVTAYTPTTTAPITNYIPALQTAVSNVARFDHDPVTGESKGLLIEEQRTNLLTYSDQFDNAAWTKTRSSITANTVVAPDGTLTGDKLIEDTTASNTHFVSQSTSFTSGTTYTLTVYAKAGERPALVLSTSGISAAGGAARFNLTTGVAISASGSLASFSMTSVGNGWYRCQITQAATSTISDSWQIRTDNGSTSSYTGDGTSGIYIWGAQLEAGAFPTSYIPTVASQVTRSADSASMTGTNFSSWYRQDEGTVYANAVLPRQNTIAGTRVIQFGVTTADYMGIFYRGSGATGCVAVYSGVTQFDMSPTGVLSSGSVFNVSLSYKANDFAVSGNGGSVSTDTIGNVPVVSALYIGSDQGFGVLNGTIKRIAYYPKRLSNTELQSITS